ncbi:MAG: flavin reductase family protein [Clostridia bacterium]|jgi:flavin reductase (DIM6/NTAB) family NADH-FMN oxidoreductase RutF|nr:flavin reductase family protein [Clostridia bacterium]NLV33507.1 flavin reductase family protein [Clostridiaceae bacterium]
MEKKKVKIKAAVEPKSRVIVSVRDKNGKDNALVVACCCNCSISPPMVMVGIMPSKYSYHMIKENPSFVVNLVSKNQRDIYNYLGSVSGRDEDKLDKINKRDGDIVNASILTDCPVNIECTVINSIITGSHEMFIGKVECIHADEDIINEKGDIDYSKIDFI